MRYFFVLFLLFFSNLNSIGRSSNFRSGKYLLNKILIWRLDAVIKINSPLRHEDSYYKELRERGELVSDRLIFKKFSEFLLSRNRSAEISDAIYFFSLDNSKEFLLNIYLGLKEIVYFEECQNIKIYSDDVNHVDFSIRNLGCEECLRKAVSINYISHFNIAGACSRTILLFFIYFLRNKYGRCMEVYSVDEHGCSTTFFIGR